MSKPDFRDSIQEMWEIQETQDEELRLMGYPFCLVRTGPTGHQTWFQCRTIDEAHSKLNSIATELDRKGHVLAVA